MKITTKKLNALQKKADKVNSIKDRIEKLKEQLMQIEKESKYLNYLGTESIENLTVEENAQLCKICDTLRYAGDLD